MYNKRFEFHERRRNNGRHTTRSSPESQPSTSMEQDSTKLRSQIRCLELDIQNLREKKRILDQKLADATECEKLFRLWGGYDIEESSEVKFTLKFLAYCNGKMSHEYSIGFHQQSKFWVVTSHNLPFSMKLVTLRVKDAQIDTPAKLSSMIRSLQHEVNLFVKREEQFNEAKLLESSVVRVHPSKATTSAMLEFHVDDNNGSDLSEVCVYLTYHSDKFFPEEPIFKFKGGDLKAHDAFKQQLLTLEHMRLKDAISSAFLMEGLGSDTSTINVTN